EMGVVLRTEEPLAPALRLAFHRFGIPARFYFARPLAETAPARILGALVESALAGWSHEGLLRAVQAGLLSEPEADLTARELREQIPAAGLQRVPAALAFLHGHQTWEAAHAPADWPGILLAAIPRDRIVPATPGERREAAEARDARRQLERTLADAARAFEAVRGSEPVTIESFWPAAQDAMAAAQYRSADGRRNAVAVMDVYEARQWRLPVIFVGALLEGDFPRRHQPDTLLGDRLRAKLAELGVPLRTSEDRQVEEDFLFEFAATRASEHLVLSYPRFDPKGKATLPSFLLEAYGAVEETPSRTIRPTPQQSRVLAAARERLEDEVLDRVTDRFEEWHPTAIEAFLQCPFLFFARHTLAVEERPVTPDERFDARLRGTIVHRTMAEWHQDPRQAILSLFEREFERACKKHRVVPGFETLRWRIAMRRGLERFAKQFEPPAGWRIEPEKEIRFDLTEDIRITGRADRVDHRPGGEVFVVDYKFSGAQKLAELAADAENGLAVQAGIYLAGLSADGKVIPAGFAYVSLREPEKPKEWREPEEIANLIQVARASAQEAVEGVREGLVAPKPADPKKCEHCDWSDACRVGSAVKVAAMGGEEG
nr:PD-(D/E)XK nuclease family protein [Bryobacter sp.]